MAGAGWDHDMDDINHWIRFADLPIASAFGSNKHREHPATVPIQSRSVLSQFPSPRPDPMTRKEAYEAGE